MKEVNDIEIFLENDKLHIGDEARLIAKITPIDATDQTIYWQSSNSDIAEIAKDGTIYAKSFGSVEITATTKNGRHKASCTIIVYEHTTGIEMANQLSLPIDNTYTLVAKTLPLSTSDGNIIFSSDNKAVVSVDDKGVLYANKKGVCIITATSVDGGYTAKCEVTVTQPVEALSLEKHSVKLIIGNSEQLLTQISPSTADEKGVTWVSSNEKIASVDNYGNVTAKKTGEAWIKAVSQDNPEAKDSCKITVIQPVKGISLNYKTYELGNIGESVELIATVLPDDASNKNIRWTSSNESVCIVSRGFVVGVGYGTAVIIAKTEDGEYLATCTINVVNITDVPSVENNEPVKYHIYNEKGAKLARLQKGINIIRFSDGTFRKVLIR